MGTIRDHAAQAPELDIPPTRMPGFGQSLMPDGTVIHTNRCLAEAVAYLVRDLARTTRGGATFRGCLASPDVDWCEAAEHALWRGLTDCLCA